MESPSQSNEIVAAPKVYGFDTGFICAHRGWTSPRPGDMGQLWEHYVLNEITAQLQTLQTAGACVTGGTSKVTKWT